MGSLLLGYRPWAGDFREQRNGALTASNDGTVLAFGLANAQERGLTFVAPGDVVYEGMMSSSVDDGGLEFRGTDATLKINRAGFNLYREEVPKDQNPILSERSYRDGTIDHMENFFDCVKSRKEPNAPIETGVAAARAGHIANLANKRGGQITWPLKA